jgi:hypothetical protein
LQPADHKSARNYRGRVKATHSKILVSDQSLISYMKRKIRLVGTAMHGWVKAIDALGVKRIPGWIRRQKGSSGIYQQVLVGDKPYVIIGNDVPYIQETGLENRIIDRSITNLLRNLPKQIEQTIKGIERKAMKGVR